MCEGMIPKAIYYSSTTSATHWLLPKEVEVPEAMKQYIGSYYAKNPWKHSCEFCSECAVIIAIENDVTLVTAKEMYELEG